MSTVIVKGVVRNGRVELNQPLNLPDGAEVEIHAPESDAPMTPEEIAAVLARMEAAEPLEMSDEELAAWKAERKEQKEREKAAFNAYSDRLRGIWE